ncbi:MAG: methylated-DNA--[protein]-cysteine S-methyltransferase [Rickettsiales bacterium]|nr:methylated-DNA--[protein]-cysteine S-methyltransferase [Rickettsiales bacterium]
MTDKQYYHYTLDCQIGSITLLASDEGLVAIMQGSADELQVESTFDRVKLAPYAEAVQNFFNSSVDELPITLDVEQGTELQRAVWDELLRIPYGETITYSELAKRVGKPTAVRAVASACGKNPMPLLIPCHRVVAKDGTLGGFTWGLPVKEQLLRQEGVVIH